ncbi:two-component sensor histidine kinase [Paenibacillus sp. BIHB 4019]|uniref:histidine kinase n=1 Tax=Paenibacillus sp. BIHB 4019 TaxID=1870819 RepID=A0A1B2DP37_9BACL|nr:HAMP domain-containing sensor histidine kinase [Paenibacillus sp. BIHB 4019]ANY69464.1 two-component sensor histidine kinase [Paenibacillus sp. BIHB 4019]
MSIRLKLLLSYAAMLVIPLFFIMLISLLMLVMFRGDLQNLKGIYESTEDIFNHEDLEQVAKEIIRATQRQPDLLRDDSYLNEMTLQLQDQNSGIVVRLNDAIVYRSLGLPQDAAWLAELPAYAGHTTRQAYAEKKVGNAAYAFLQYDLNRSGNEQISLFMMAKVNPLTNFIRKYFIVLFSLLILIFILTHVLLTTIMSKSIIRPLHKLREAAQEMKEGKMDLQIQVAGKDEIGQLGVAFEEMRLRLQHSTSVQQQYEENRKELIANISHDLKTPLTAIRGYVAGMMDGIADTPEKSLKYMQTIALKSDELDHLINELFLYSKLDLNREPFQFEVVQLLPFLSDWIEELEFELEKRGIAFVADLSLDSETVVSLDRDHFKRVLNNIIQNSLKYMNKAQPKIHLAVYSTQQAAVLEIADNGKGIETEAIQHVFERFYRTDKSRNAHTGGSGLGLAIAKQIMEGHGGVITASSELDVGTTIKLCIPTTTRE